MTGWVRDSRCLRLPRVLPCSNAGGWATRTDLSSRGFLSGLQAPALLQQHLRGPRLGLCADAAVLDKKMELSVFGVSGCTHVYVRQHLDLCWEDRDLASIRVIAAADGRYGHDPRPTATLAGGHPAVRYHCDRNLGWRIVEPMDPPTQIRPHSSTCGAVLLWQSILCPDMVQRPVGVRGKEFTVPRY